MKRRWLALGMLALTWNFAGCDGGDSKPSEEQQKADFGTKSIDQMKGDIGVPGKGGAMQRPKPAAK